MKIRAYGEWVLVQADQRVKKTAGGIHLTDELTMIERKMEGTGRILSVGSRVRVPVIEPGLRVAFRGFLKDAHKVDKTEDGCDIFIIHYKDLLATVEEGVELGAFS
jgi:co-chaperonin GroES (HSP10)